MRVIEPTDNELVLAVGRGDRSAVGVLFERHHRAVFELCYRMTGDASVSDDLTQETFVRVLKYAKGFQHRAACATWLHRIARNVCLDHFDGEKRRAVRLERATALADVAATPPVDPRLATLGAALQSLPPDKREVLVLSRYGGFSYAEIAEICGTTVGAIKVRAHRAMRDLRKAYQERDNGHDV